MERKQNQVFELWCMCSTF